MVCPIYLFRRINRYGAHSGYEQLARYSRMLNTETKVLTPDKALAYRLLGKLYSLWRHLPPGDQAVACVELKSELLRLMIPNAVAHLLYAEYHLPHIAHWTKAPVNIIATIHEPKSYWSIDSIDKLKHLSQAIVLYHRDIEFFESIVGTGAVHFVPHGVDADFFRPAEPAPAASWTADRTPSSQNNLTKHILFVGKQYRNFGMLTRVMETLHAKHNNLHFDLVVFEKDLPELSGIHKLTNTTLHSWITDSELRQLYQNSYLTLLPLDDGGGNNTVVESLASGVPLVTTDCGGIRDYGGGYVYPIVHNNDDQAMIDLVEKYLDNPSWRDDIATRCREFALRELDWNVVARKHMDVYDLCAKQFVAQR
jgi:glycosyltransferase involved in cell wall biosynthesis